MTQLFRGTLKLIVNRAFSLKDGADAQQLLGEGKQFGKLVLVPDSVVLRRNS